MRLKQLHLHGFKTFAPKTDLSFGKGLTAVVGPNGSGKSNVADAVRWVLGEQSLSNLRAKKTEDLIFAGSSKRAPLGMAEVSITLDNSDRLMPVDFAEVTLTRRAYRSGENEYYINKSRVRLREIVEVASSLGQAYTVVGQGLVDAALSLRPEERRELFEEAAGIRGYFAQREDALRRLAHTQENVERVQDLLSELEPQVRRMERQARQAQEYGKLETELREILKLWYGGRWLLIMEELRKAQASEAEAAAQVEAGKSSLGTQSAQLAEARKKVWALVDTVSALHEARAQAQSRHAAQAQAQAVLSERLSAARLHKEALLSEQAALLGVASGVQEQLSKLENAAAENATELQTLEELAHEVTSEFIALDRQISQAQHEVNSHASRLDDLIRRNASLTGKVQDAQRQRAEQESVATEAEVLLEGLHQRLAGAEHILGERHAAVTEAQRLLAEGERTHSLAQKELAASRSSQSDADSALREITRRADALHAQIAALAGEQQASLYSSVRVVVGAAKAGKLDGYVGTVAELLRVPPHLEVAVEAALGGRLQDVVVRSWGDAEQAIAMLKTVGAGRATFLPLDTLRVSSAPAPPRGPGIVGLARDLVEYDPQLQTLAESLLGRLLIVEDLPSARKTIAALAHSAAWTLTTLGGEVVRPGGSLTGGSSSRADDARARDRTLLGRERKRRELLVTQSDLSARITAAEKAVDEAIAGVCEAEAMLVRVAAQNDAYRKSQAAAQMAYMEQQGALSRLQQELSWRTGLLAQTRKEIEALKAAAESAVEERASVEAQVAPLKATVADVTARVDRLKAERSDVAASAGASQTRMAVLSETVRNLRARYKDVEREAARHQARQAELHSRIEIAVNDEVNLAGQLDKQAVELGGLAHELEELEARVGPSEREVRVLEGEVSRIESEQSKMQAALLESETAHSRAAVEVQRCMGAVDSLTTEVSEELGVETPSTIESGLASPLSQSAPVPVGAPACWLSDAPTASSAAQHYARDNGHFIVSAAENAERERGVYALKAKIRRLGPVNPLAMEEHAALSERYSYLQGQLTDLASAAEALHHVIAELDRMMRDQFAVTFEQVNAAFQGFFNQLFLGGTARLELTNPQDVSASGIELFAQPPGKRMQPLAALSGGERALTSAALLFALLKVRPVPFCLLDEVDAALDESNVTRFRAALHELEQKTQFVVISHNRGTIEAADTLYGVSMAGDGTSQLLSLNVGEGN